MCSALASAAPPSAGPRAPPASSPSSPSWGRACQRLRRQRRRRHHDLLARRRPVRLRAAVGDPGQPDRPVLHPGGGRAARTGHGPGPHGPHPRALRRALGRLRGARRCSSPTSARPSPSSPASGQRSSSSACRPRSARPSPRWSWCGFIALGSYSRVQYLFVGVGIGVSVAYVISAFLAKPDWGEAARTWFIPHLIVLPVVLAGGRRHGRHHDHAVGPGVHPVVRRGQGPATRTTCAASRLDVFVGALLTNVIAGIHRDRLRRDALCATGDHVIQTRPTPRRPSGRSPGPAPTVLFAGRAAGGLVPGPGRRAA